MSKTVIVIFITLCILLKGIFLRNVLKKIIHIKVYRRQWTPSDDNTSHVS